METRILLIHLVSLSFLCLYGNASTKSRMEEQFEKCCGLGTSWASEGLRCEKFTGPVSGVPMVEQALCLETVDICCVRTYHQKSCEKGINNARKSLSCAESSQSSGNKKYDDYQRDCCEGCKLGILSGSLGQNCAFKAFSFGKPWDSAFLDCCYETVPSTTSQTSNSTESLTSTTSSENASSTVPEGTPTETTSDTNSESADITESTIPTPSLDNICELLKGMLCSDICVPTPGSYYCTCPEGFVLLEDQKTCRSDGPIEHSSSPSTTVSSTSVSTTEQTKGAQSTPRCPLGFRYNSSARVCDDIDECAERLDICGHEVCYNQPGGYSCSPAPAPIIDTTPRPSTYDTVGPMQCKPGFRYKRNYGCADINECQEIEDACTSDEECTNTVGSYTCNCRTGFRRDELTQACVDINECLLQNDCLSSQRCDNTLGSYNCVRFLPCGTGYTLNAATEICEDDDECILGTHDCGNGYHCRNTLGSYRCDRNPRGYTRPPATTRATTAATTTTTQTTTRRPTSPFTPSINSRFQPNRTCTDGFRQGPSGQCIDIDECALGASNPCSRLPLQECINTIGSYRCVPRIICSAGFKLDPESQNRCVDIDECADGSHRCGPRQTCENRQGGYACGCPAGFAVGPNHDCVDINECSLHGGNICGTTGKCENTIGSFRCVCEPGFERLPGSHACGDINECERTPGICQHQCINVWGSYRCVCQPGFTLNHDNRSCSDVDECEVFKANNPCVGFCDNTPGSYSCRCPDGYRLGVDGRTCQDIDECAAGRVCRDPNEMCQNTRGGYRCNRIQCPQGYRRDQQRKNRCVRSSRYCLPGDIACYQSPSHFSFNFITFVSMLPIPRTGQLELFTMRGTHLPGSVVRFSMALVNSRAAPGVTRATEACFALKRPSPSQAVLVLTRSLPGPQEIELDLSMEIYHDTAFAGSAVAKLFIYVTQYEF